MGVSLSFPIIHESFNHKNLTFSNSLKFSPTKDSHYTASLQESTDTCKNPLAFARIHRQLLDSVDMCCRREGFLCSDCNVHNPWQPCPSVHPLPLLFRARSGLLEGVYSLWSDFSDSAYVGTCSCHCGGDGEDHYAAIYNREYFVRVIHKVSWSSNFHIQHLNLLGRH